MSITLIIILVTSAVSYQAFNKQELHQVNFVEKPQMKINSLKKQNSHYYLIKKTLVGIFVNRPLPSMHA